MLAKSFPLKPRFIRNATRMSSSVPPILINENASGNTITVTLNRPKALNALDKEMCGGIKDMVNGWTSSAGSKKPLAFLLKGAGDKAFCAGGDVKSIWDEIANEGLDKSEIGIGKSGYKHSDFFRTEYEMNYALGISDVPQISFWNGFVMGGGVGVSVLGKYRVANEKTMFAMPETAIGLFPDVGSSSWLPQLKPSGFGMYIGLTGQRLFAYDLLTSGIATHYVPAEKTPELEEALNNIKEGDNVEDILVKYTETPDDSKSLLKQHESAIENCFHPSKSLAEIKDALKAVSKSGSVSAEWAQKTLNTLSKMSPTSILVTYHQLQRGAGNSLKDCLEMEFRLSQRCMAGPDFTEGIRAVLVDKDHNPQWQQAPDNVEPYFESLAYDLKLK